MAAQLILILISNYYKWKQCVLSKYKQVGPPKCTEQRLEFFTGYLDRHSIETLKLMCGDFEEQSEKCDNLLNQIQKQKSRQTHQPSWSSPILPSIELFD